MCLKWDFSGIEGNYATICKQLQIRIISENIFSLILIVYRHRKLGYPRLKKSGTCKHAAYRCLAPFSDVPTERPKRPGETLF